MDRHTGRRLSTEEHIQQSVTDILTTPIGSRIKRRTYGSLIPDLIDQPFNDPIRLRLIAATFIALAHWEPRIKLLTVTAYLDSEGQQVIELEGQRTTGPLSGRHLRMSIHP